MKSEPLSSWRFWSNGGIAVNNKENWIKLIKIAAGYDTLGSLLSIFKIMKKIFTSKLLSICIVVCRITLIICKQ